MFSSSQYLSHFAFTFLVVSLFDKYLFLPLGRKLHEGGNDARFVDSTYSQRLAQCWVLYSTKTSATLYDLLYRNKYEILLFLYNFKEKWKYFPLVTRRKNSFVVQQMLKVILIEKSNLI